MRFYDFEISTCWWNKELITCGVPVRLYGSWWPFYVKHFFDFIAGHAEHSDLKLYLLVLFLKDYSGFILKWHDSAFSKSAKSKKSFHGKIRNKIFSKWIWKIKKEAFCNFVGLAIYYFVIQDDKKHWNTIVIDKIQSAYILWKCSEEIHSCTCTIMQDSVHMNNAKDILM